MKRRILLGAALALAGCGFEPLYGRFGDSSIADDLATIKIHLIANRSGQILRNHLLDGLTPRGEPQQAAYVLRVELFEPLPQDIGITRNESVVRYSYSTAARFRLHDAAGKELLRSEASSVSTYEVTNSEFATVAGQLNARDRVLAEIATEIKAQIAVWFRTRRGRTA
jgi:LPS-assembly lipoprotein